MGEGLLHLVRRCWRWLLILALWVPGLAVGAVAPAPDGCFSPMVPGESLAQVLDRADRFDCTSPQTATGPGDYWVRAGGLSASTRVENPLVLRFAPEWQRRLTVVFGFADGSHALRVIPAESQLAVTRLGQTVELPLPAHAAPLTQVLIGVEGAANISRLVREIRIVPLDQARALDNTDIAIFACVMGLFIALLVYNLVLWSTLRERFQFYYCASVVAMMGYTLSFSGGMTLISHSADAIELMQQRYVTLAMVAGFLLLFVRHYFEPGTIGPRLAIAVNVAVGVLAAVALPFAADLPVDPHLADRVYLLAFIPLPLLVGGITYAAWRQRSQLIRQFMAVWSVPLLIVAIRLLHATHLIEYPVWFDSCVVLGMAVESLMSSLALGYRIKLIRRERDVARAEEAFARRLANSDPLTGLLNRRALIGTALAEPGAYQLVLLDIDHFKRVNDSHGHDVGDAVLVRIAALLGEWSAVYGGRTARLGGEEFALLGTVEQGVAGQVERLLTLVREHRMPGPRRVTLSAGVATGTVESEADWQALYHEADAALYRAKHAGRDRVVHAQRQPRAA